MHTPVSPCSQTPGLSHHVLPTLSAVPQNRCPLLCQDRSLSHRGIHCCWCGHTCLHRASTAATSMAGDVSEVCQTGTSLRTFLLTMPKGPLLQLHRFCSCKSVSCKQTICSLYLHCPQCFLHPGERHPLPTTSQKHVYQNTSPRTNTQAQCQRLRAALELLAQLWD